MSSIPSAQPQTEPAAQAIHCPACGYDLRGMTGDRCSECGLVIDREDVAEDGPTGLNNVTMADLVVPWVAGVVTVPVLIVLYAALTGFSIVRAPMKVLRPHRATASLPDTVRAIGCYVTGPLFFLFTA